VRPHEISVLPRPDGNALEATLLHSASIGPVARLEFALREADQTVNVDLPRKQWEALNLKPGAVAYLRPTTDRRFPAPA
jgi:sulfate/thiosulfate transport system ATP-binding protein